MHLNTKTGRDVSSCPASPFALTGFNSVTEVQVTTLTGFNSVTEVQVTTLTGFNSVTEVQVTTLTGFNSVTEVQVTTALRVSELRGLRRHVSTGS